MLGVNYYNGEAIGHEPPDGRPPRSVNGGRVTGSPFPAVHDVRTATAGVPRTAMDWEISPRV